MSRKGAEQHDSMHHDVPDEHIIWPRDGWNHAEVARTDAQIQATVKSTTAIKKWITSGEKLMFWHGKLSECQIEQIRKLDGVGRSECCYIVRAGTNSFLGCRSRKG